MGRRKTRKAIKRIAKPEKINRYFDLDIIDINRHRYNLDIFATEGQYQLIPTDRDEGFLIFLLSAQEHLRENGFDKFTAIEQSKESYPYVRYRGQLLVLQKNQRGQNFKYTSDTIFKGAETLAQFHRAARGLNPMPGSEFKVSWGKWPDRCFEEVNQLVKYKLLVKDEKKLHSFDQRFLEHVDSLIERGLKAWQRFNSEAYRNLLKKEMEEKAFNLHSFKDSKLKRVSNEVIIDDMNRIRYELQIYDLANYLDEILRETDIPVKEVIKAVDTYHDVRPMSEQEWDALIALILYPKEFYRLIRHNYENKRTKDKMQRFDEFITRIKKEDELIAHLKDKRSEVI